VAESQNPGASVSRVALDNNLNASLCAHPFAGSGSGRKKEQLHPHRNSPSRRPDCSGMASRSGSSVRGTSAQSVVMIRIDEIWLATEPLDMRAGPDTALARVVQVFGSARPHFAYLFANKRSNRMKVLIHDGLGAWLCAR